jgi:hypothetical protein
LFPGMPDLRPMMRKIPPNATTDVVNSAYAPGQVPESADDLPAVVLDLLMVDPVSAAASAAARTAVAAASKKLTSKSGSRLGVREERRQAYSRFQPAMAEMA